MLNPSKYKRTDEEGDYLRYTHLYDTTPKFNDYGSDKDKILAMLRNPAMMKVVALQCDLFSLGKSYVYKKDKEREQDPILDLLAKPNKLQSEKQFLWDYMFWRMTGTAYLYVDNSLPDSSNLLYFLDPSKMEWPTAFDDMQDKLVLSNKSFNDMQRTIVKYKYNDGTTMSIPLSKIIVISDLTNGLGNWYKSPSRIEALEKIIPNSEAALDATNINIRYSGKFLVAGQADPNDVTKIGMGEVEKKSIEQRVNGPKQVHAIKTMIDIKRFVEDMASLQLNEAYMNAYFLIGSMFGIPKDVLEAYATGGSTYENQEKAVGRHVAYTLQPAADDLTNSLGNYFDYNRRKLEIEISWDHLPFMQVFEMDRQSAKSKQVETWIKLLNQGVSLEEANKFLDLNFESGEKQETRASLNITGQSGNQSGAGQTN